MANVNAIPETVHALVREGFVFRPGKPKVEVRKDPAWRKVCNAGTRLWLDTGDIEEASRLWNAEFDALTTNNTLLNKEVQKGIYDALIRKAAAAIRKADPRIGPDLLVLEVAFVLNAYHGLRLVEQFDANVSVELHTDLAHDVQRTVAYGERFYRVCPERFYVKVPMTPAGFLGARKLVELGIPINFTLGFSARQNYLAALLSKPRFVNVFLGRLNAFVADSKLGDGKNVGEKATLATQREILKLREAGRTETHLIAASLRDGPQVASLAGVDVLTMPPKVAAQYRQSPSDEVASQVPRDPEVAFAAGVTSASFNGDALWAVPEAFKDCVEDLLKRRPEDLTPETLQDHFAKAGFGDFMPRWSEADIGAITTDGKIPSFKRWQAHLVSGRIGLDALMNVSGLRSFVLDEKALDDRIRSLV